MADEYFGPALPPKTAETDEAENLPEKSICKRKHSESSSSDSGSSSSSRSSSDSGSRKRRRLSIEEPAAQDETVATKCYGASERPNADGSVNSFIGPVIPAALLANKEEEENGQDWGPSPPGDGNNELESTAAEIERRAERMKNKLLNKDDETATNVKPERETWMMELPPERTKNFALAARTFSMAVPCATGDRSSWTDTPADRAKKEQDLLSGKLPTVVEKVSNESKRLAQRDAEYAQQIEEYNKSKKREKSLLELHGEKKDKVHKKKKHKKDKHKDKRKKKSKDKDEERDEDKDKHKDKRKKKSKDKDEEKDKKKDKKKHKNKETLAERRPFDRDVDLKVNCMDAAKRQAIIKRSAQLTGRFGHGSSCGKFL